MTEEDVSEFKKWFSDYTQSFYSADEEDRKNIVLKIGHTHNVCANITAIAQSLRLDKNGIRLAETIALFHDIGRFPQYARYKTFRDADSVSHGLLGAKTLIREGILQGLSVHDRELIINAVKFHGAYLIPRTFDDDTVFFLKLIRDADKVDIYRVFIEYYESPKEERASATAFGVPDTPEYSETMLSSLFNKQVASYSDIKTENDFKLMKLSWIYDIHFNGSLRLIQERDSIRRIAEKLPRTEGILKALSDLEEYVTHRLASD